MGSTANVYVTTDCGMKTEVSLVRSSAAEYLTFVAAGGGSEASVEMRYEDENVWLTQKMMAELYGVSVPAINQHLKRIFEDNELEPLSTIKEYLIVQREGNRQVQRWRPLSPMPGIKSW